MKSANCDVDIVILTDARQHRWAMRAACYLLQLPQNVCTFRSFPHSSLYGSWTGRSLYCLFQASIWNRRMMWEITKFATVAWGHAFLHSGVAVVWHVCHTVQGITPVEGHNFLVFASQSVMRIACCSRYEWRGWRCSGVLPSYHSAQWWAAQPLLPPESRTLCLVACSHQQDATELAGEERALSNLY